MRTRTFLILGLLAALLVAGVGSYYASTHPDGLQYVAEQAGFSDKAEDSAAEGSPLSGYEVKGVENDRVSGGLAGVVGALVVLLLAGGLAYAVRRKGSTDHGEPAGPAVDGGDHPADADQRADHGHPDRA